MSVMSKRMQYLSFTLSLPYLLAYDHFSSIRFLLLQHSEGIICINIVLCSITNNTKSPTGKNQGFRLMPSKNLKNSFFLSLQIFLIRLMEMKYKISRLS